MMSLCSEFLHLSKMLDTLPQISYFTYYNDNNQFKGRNSWQKSNFLNVFIAATKQK